MSDREIQVRPAAAGEPVPTRPHGHGESTTVCRYDDAPRRVYWELTRACGLAFSATGDPLSEDPLCVYQPS